MNMNKRFLSLTLALVMVLGSLASLTPVLAAETAVELSDIDGHWAEAHIKKAVEEGLVKGYKDGTFKPGASLARAEMATILARAFELKDEASLKDFTDVKSTDWFFSAMAKAVEAGIFKGDGDKLMPTENIRRDHAFATVARALKLEKAEDFNKAFPDLDEMDQSVKGEVAALVNRGYVGGDQNGNLNPAGEITRAEMTKIVNLALGFVIEDEKEPEEPTKDLKVESVSAITATEVRVTIAELAADLDGANVVVKNAAGQVVETIASDLKAGAKEATFAFKTPLTVSATSEWTVDGVKYVVSEFGIIAVEPVDTKSKNLVVEFNSPLTALDASEITIREKVSQVRSGIASVRLAADGMSAQITLVGDDATGGLKSTTLYTLSITKGMKVTYFDFQIPAIYENAVVRAVNTTTRTITVAEKGTTGYGANKTISVPANVAFDFNEALGRDLTIWADKDNKVTKFVYNDETVILDAIEYETKTIGGVSTIVVKTVTSGETYEIATGANIGVQITNKTSLDQTIGNKDNYAKLVLGTDGKVKSIIAHDLNSTILVQKVEQETVSGYGLAASLKDYTILKAGKTITIAEVKVGDAIFYNTATKVAEVYNNEVKGKISAFYNNEIQLEGKSYSILNAQGVINDKFVNLSNNNVAAFTNVTAYLDRAGQLELLTGERSEKASATSVAFAKENISTFNFKGVDFMKLVTQKADGSEVIEEVNAEKLKVVEGITVSGNIRFQTADLTATQTAAANVLKVSGFFISDFSDGTSKKLFAAIDGNTISAAKAEVEGTATATASAGSMTKAFELSIPAVLENTVEVTKSDNVVTGLNFLGNGTVISADAKLDDKALVTSSAAYQLNSSVPVFIIDKLAAGQTTQTYTSTTWGELDSNISKIYATTLAPRNGEFTVYNDGKGNAKYVVINESQIEGPKATNEFEGVVSEAKYGTQSTPELAYIKFAGDDTQYTPSNATTTTYVIGEVLKVEAKDSKLITITKETTGTTNKVGIYSATNTQLADGEFSIAGTGGYSLANVGAKVYEVTGTGVNQKIVERTYADLVNLKANQYIEASLIAANSKKVDAIVIRTAPTIDPLNAGVTFTADTGTATNGVTFTDNATTTADTLAFTGLADNVATVKVTIGANTYTQAASVNSATVTIGDNTGVPSVTAIVVFEDVFGNTSTPTTVTLTNAGNTNLQ